MDTATYGNTDIPLNALASTIDSLKFKPNDGKCMLEIEFEVCHILMIILDIKLKNVSHYRNYLTQQMKLIKLAALGKSKKTCRKIEVMR